MSDKWRVEVTVLGENNWYTNAMRYDSRDKALEAAEDLAGRWMMVQRWRAVSDETPLREAYVEGSEDGAW